MDSSILLTSFQMLLVGGVGGVPLVAYATKGLIPKEEAPLQRPAFSNEYQELMWLAGKAKEGLRESEMLRFYELRDKWPGMHSDTPRELTGDDRP